MVFGANYGYIFSAYIAAFIILSAMVLFSVIEHNICANALKAKDKQQ